MGIDKFEDIIAWQKAGAMTIEIYKEFKDCMDYSFKDQICRASVSVMNNIAEGFERRTNKEFKNFLYIAKGLCGEVRSMLYLALRLGNIDKLRFDFIYKLSVEISKMLSGLTKTLA